MFLGFPCKGRVPAAPNGGGFSLVELTLVVLILGVLAAIVIPRFTDAQTEAKATQAGSTMRQIANVTQRYHARHGVYPADPNRGIFPPQLAEELVEFDCPALRRGAPQGSASQAEG